MNDKKQIYFQICMGSSCFARGNAENLTFIEDFIAKNSLDAKIELIGSRCENKCAYGPNVIIDGVQHSQVALSQLKSIVGNQFLSKK